MSSRPASARRGASPAIVYWVGIAVIAVIWFAGIGWRGRIWKFPVEIITDPGLPLLFGSSVGQLMLTALIISVAAIGYWICLSALKQGFNRSLWAAVAGTAIACCALLPSSLLTTPDAVHLAADVRTLWLHGRYPAFIENAPANVDDPIADVVQDFREGPSGYGPVAYIVGGLPLPFVGDGVEANIIGQKVVAALALVATAACTGLVARRLGFNPGLAAGFVGLNPLMLWEYAGNGHNDTIMSAFFMAALIFLLTESWPRRAIGLGLGAAAILTKFAIGAASPLILVRWFPRLRYLVAAGATVAGLAYIALVMTSEVRTGTAGPAGAITFTPWTLIQDATGLDDEIILGLAYSAFLICLVGIMLYRPIEDDQMLVTTAAIVMFLLLFVGNAGYLPWYQVWYVPLVAVAGLRWLTAATLTFTIGGFVIILAQNFQGTIISDMGMSNPIDTSIVVVWLAVIAAGGGTWWYDRERQVAAATAPVRRPSRQPARRRR